MYYIYNFKDIQTSQTLSIGSNFCLDFYSSGAVNVLNSVNVSLKIEELPNSPDIQLYSNVIWLSETTHLIKNTNMPKAFSYVRFSTSEQSFGDSLRRQTELATEFCEQHKLELDTEFNLLDLGVSAFRGSNKHSGNLGLFLQAVEEGRIERGSYLLAENFDRLSREEVLTALTTFMQIISKGIIVVTLADARIYTQESLTSNIGDLMYSIICMSRGHEESATKSKRLKAAWKEKRRKAVDELKPVTSLLPMWLELADNKIVINEERANIVRRIFDLTINGYGRTKIIKLLNSEGVNPFKGRGNGWTESYIQKILTDGKAVGIYTPGIMVDGVRELQDPIHNFFPRVVSDETYQAARVAAQSRKHTGGEVGKKVNIMANLTKCGCCGGPIVRLNKGYDIKLHCDKRRRGLSKDDGCKGWIKFDTVESQVLADVTELNLEEIFKEDSSLEKSLHSRLQVLNSKKEDANLKISNLVDAVAMGGEALPLMAKIKQIEGEIQDLDKIISEVQDEYTVVNQHKTAVSENVKELQSLLNSGDEGKQMKARAVFRQLIEKIIIYPAISKVVIHYKHSSKMIVKFKKGKSVVFSED